MKKIEKKVGLFKTKSQALNDAKIRRKNSNNDISPNYSSFFRVEKTKKPKNPKKPGYYVIQTLKEKSNQAKEQARKNRRRK